MSEYYAMGSSQAISDLKSTPQGLTSAEAKARLLQYGYNELEKKGKLTAWIIFIDQFKNALILLLIAAGFLSFFLGETVEAIAIFVIIGLNVLLGFIQEFKAERAIETLEKISAPVAKVLRDGEEHKVPAKELVPGDIVLLEAGDIVPADSRIIEASSLQIDESSLTGESMPSKKVTEPFKEGTHVADQENMAFMGSVVTYGKGKAIITSTGMKTEFGKIASSLQTTTESKTPLQVKFEQLTKQIGVIVIVLVATVLVTGILTQTLSPGKMMLFALTIIVSTLPNALPLVVTAGLSVGAKRLAKKNMLIKKLPAAESLGATTIICTDKTGTITKNQMTITKIYWEGKTVDVTGTGYEPTGSFQLGNRKLDPAKMELLLRTGYLCNNAKLTHEGGKYDIIGDPTEGSMIVLGRKGNLSEEKLTKEFKLVDELPFDSDRKRMTVIYKHGKNIDAYVKGAPDLVLKLCDSVLENGKVKKLSKQQKAKILAVNNSYAEKALRVIALAYRPLPAKMGKYKIDNVETKLIFLGLVGMIDPPRAEVKEAVKQCHDAGIQIMMITGDYAVTAQAVAEQIGLFSKGDVVLTGDELEKMSDDQLMEQIEHVRIIARAMPIQKSRIVDLLKKKGHVVAMTGDGVNDAPALKKADIGIAMGITGTDVAKEVAKAILTDDNFATIVNAVQEGRNIYDKIIKSTKFFLSCNTGEITSVFLTIMMGLPLPLLPLQVLMMSLLTDNFPALGLGFEEPEKGIMTRPPRNPKDKPITTSMFFLIIMFGLIMGGGTLMVFMHYQPEGVAKAQTVAFTTLVIFQMFSVMNSRTLHHSLKALNPFSNLWLLGAVGMSVLLQAIVIYWQPMQSIFGTVPISAYDWLVILMVSIGGFILMEISKFFVRDAKKAPA